MTNSAIALQRLYHQRLSRPDLRSPGEVVHWFGALQAQDYLGSLYAIGLRMPEATQPIVEKAIEQKTILRTWPMRGTLHFLSSEDARWMLKLLARRVNRKYTGMHRKNGLTGEIFNRAGEVFTRALQGGKQLTRDELAAVLAEAGIPVAGLQRGFLLGYWAQEGLLCLGPRRGKQHTFTLLEEWVPPGRKLEGEEALADLAGRYFASHGPATLRDFAWWSGLSMGEARTGLEAAQPQLVPETIEGQVYWSGGPASLAPGPSPHAYLLPQLDEFTVAYQDRSAVIDPARFQEAGHALGANIILDGLVAGTWKRTLSKDSVKITLHPFAPLSPPQQAALAEAARRYARFLGLPMNQLPDE